MPVDRVQFTKGAARKTKDAVTDYLARTGSGPGADGPVLFEQPKLGKTLEAIDSRSSGLVQIYSADRETAKGAETSSGDDRQLTCYSRRHDFYAGEWCLITRFGGTGLEILPLGPETRSRSLGSAWTMAEYDPATGDIERAYDRGRPRSGAIALRDVEVLFHTDDDGNKWIYAAGAGYINRDTGILKKWSAETGDLEWESDIGAFTGPIQAVNADGNSANRLCMSSDGFLWVTGSDATNSCIGRFDPATGEQTHKFSVAYATTAELSVYPLSADGKVLVRYATVLGGKWAVVLDNTATEVASQTYGQFRDVEMSGSHIYATFPSGGSGTALKIYDSTLTELDSRVPPAGEVYGAIATDGTTVWTTTSGTANMLRAYDASNLATENWNAAHDGNPVTRLLHANSALYMFAASVRKHSTADGSETWESPTTDIRPTTRAHSRNCCAVGTDFALVLTADTNEQLFCLEDTDGTVRWFDRWPNGIRGAYITDDDRVFVSGNRMGP